jgi:hypothetical protein
MIKATSSYGLSALQKPEGARTVEHKVWYFRQPTCAWLGSCCVCVCYLSHTHIPTPLPPPRGITAYCSEVLVKQPIATQTDQEIAAFYVPRRFLNVRSELFWDITQRRVVILYRRFGITYRSHLQGSRSLRLDWLFDTWRWDRSVAPKRR